MAIYTAVIDARAVTAAVDMFKIKAPITDTGSQTVSSVLTTFPETASDLRIREVRLGQFTDFGDAAAEILSVQIIKYSGDTGLGDTGHGATGTNLRVVPSPIDGHADTGNRLEQGAKVTVTGDTLVTDTGETASAGLTKIIVSDAWNIAAGWWWYPPEEEMITLKSGDVLVVRTTVPADSLTVNATLVYEEIGKASP